MQRHCHLLLLLLLLLPWHTISVSSGGAEIYLCDPISKLWGCTKFDPPSPPTTNCIMADRIVRALRLVWRQASGSAAGCLGFGIHYLSEPAAGWYHGIN